MEKVTTILAYVGLAVMLAGLGYVGGRHSAKAVISKMETTATDTLWEVVHDTAWVETAVKISRIDTVRLARVVCAENAPTTHDTITVHDSVFVEVPIESKTFVGDNWRVTAHGYGVGLDEVWINRPTIYVTKTQTRTKRWNFNVGAQVGYGYTMHGGSPYVGLGVGFGYTF